MEFLTKQETGEAGCHCCCNVRALRGSVKLL